MGGEVITVLTGNDQDLFDKVKASLHAVYLTKKKHYFDVEYEGEKVRIHLSKKSGVSQTIVDVVKEFSNKKVLKREKIEEVVCKNGLNDNGARGFFNKVLVGRNVVLKKGFGWYAVNPEWAALSEDQINDKYGYAEEMNL